MYENNVSINLPGMFWKLCWSLRCWREKKDE